VSSWMQMDAIMDGYKPSNQMPAPHPLLRACTFFYLVVESHAEFWSVRCVIHATPLTLSHVRRDPTSAGP
jgi:hypothetical protein